MPVCIIHVYTAFKCIAAMIETSINNSIYIIYPFDMVYFFYFMVYSIRL